MRLIPQPGVLPYLAAALAGFFDFPDPVIKRINLLNNKYIYH